MTTTKTWKLTLTPDQAPTTVLTGLSNDQMGRAVLALMSGENRVIDQLDAETSAASLELAA